LQRITVHGNDVGEITCFDPSKPFFLCKERSGVSRGRTNGFERGMPASTM